jgi:hypothetical protein
MLMILLGNGVVANVLKRNQRKQFRLDRNYHRMGYVFIGVVEGPNMVRI